MIAREPIHDEPAGAPERSLPPITELCVGSLILIVIGGIFLAAHIPNSTPFALLVVSALLLAAALVALSRVQNFAWHRFRVVYGWALLAYLITAGMIEYVFVADGTRGGVLVVLSLSLVVYAVVIPLAVLAFLVALAAGVYRARRA